MQGYSYILLEGFQAFLRQLVGIAVLIVMAAAPSPAAIRGKVTETVQAVYARMTTPIGPGKSRG
jgi:hypothetical protein